jgi:hypothetical protein
VVSTAEPKLSPSFLGRLAREPWHGGAMPESDQARTYFAVAPRQRLTYFASLTFMFDRAVRRA